MEAVDHNEAPDYYILIKDPMGKWDLSRILQNFSMPRNIFSRYENNLFHFQIYKKSRAK